MTHDEIEELHVGGIVLNARREVSFDARQST